MVRKKIDPFQVFSRIFFVGFAVLTLYPFWTVLVGSLMPYNEYAKQFIKIWPTNFTIEAYRVFFQQESFLQPLKNSIVYTVVGGVLSILVTTMAAYALSRKNLVGRKFFLMAFFFTMIFSGGIIPLYVVMSGYGLTDSITGLILVELVNIIYLLIMRTNFMNIPDAIEESAKIDGAGDIRILFSIMVPMSKGTLATITLFYMVDKWNDFYNALYLIRTAANQVLQVVLYNVLFVGSNNPMKGSFSIISKSASHTESVKMAAVMVVTIPILLVYPFLQKHFVKGVMMGSIKE